MADPSPSGAPTSSECGSGTLPSFPPDLYMQNVDFSLPGSSPSPSLPFFHDPLTQNQQNEPTTIAIQHQQQVFEPSYPPLPSSAQHEYYHGCQVGGSDSVQAWWPFADDQMGFSGGTSSMAEVGPQQYELGCVRNWSQLQQQQEQRSAIIPAMAGRVQISRDDGTAAISPPSTSTSPSAPAPSPFSPWMDVVLQYPPYTQDLSLFPSLDHVGYRFVLQKELKNSDVSNIGRIVLPKRESEASLPFLSVKEGIQLTILELFTPYVWRMRYRFWPNNKSRMYVLENTGEFIRRHGLKSGDYIALYQDMNKQLYICHRRVEKPASQPTMTHPSMLHDEAQEHGDHDLQAPGPSAPDEPRGSRRRTTVVGGDCTASSSANNDVNATGVAPAGIFDVSVESGDASSLHFPDPSGSFFDGEGYGMRRLERLPSFDDCDLSIYDVEPEKRTRDGV